jgi:dTDP-4-dehydrorhamnose reductase
MKVLITGSGGLVGARLAEYLSKGGDVIALDHRALDITDRDSVFERITAERLDLIFNCAVIGVDECEHDPEKAFAVNVAGPGNLAEAASRNSAAIVHFSTNYVFDGTRETGHYTIDDEPRAVNVYARTKSEGERAVAGACERSFIVRTSWVYGGGSKGFFDKTLALLKQGEKVRAIADRWASTTFVGDLVERVVEIAEHQHYGTYHVVNDGVCSKYEFATEAARIICGSDALVEAVGEDRSGLIARRPRYTPMGCTLSDRIGLRPMRDWKSALGDHLSL